MEIKYWKIEDGIRKEIEDHYRTRLALSLKEQSAIEIVKEITFDNVAPNLNVKEVDSLISFVNKNFLEEKLEGVGLEVGAGCGFFSAVFAKEATVKKVYALEIVENIVKELMPKVVESVAGKNSNKVVGCVGEFNNIELPNNSVDFVFDFYSLHHSNNLEKTFRELFRVLKPGGFVLCFDKARSNSLSREQLDGLLDKEYPREAKINMGIDPSAIHTRRMNGEYEYRLKDWEKAFLDSGFNNFYHYHLARMGSGGVFSRIYKKMISIFPIKLQIFINNLLLRNKKVNNLDVSNVIYTRLVDNMPKEISLMMVYK
ncbi:MAG: SAM-dependent methyltransferase [Parcubacteria group bacterium GW2011_GWF2_38_76]|nr:MAG: SAM-dependent methyltransferase [Parcubacteria group bacterium GW2011_GWF2_38_76]HBM45781.1 hypothetical protein [Patescibacteria group bacterium]